MSAGVRPARQGGGEGEAVGQDGPQGTPAAPAAANPWDYLEGGGTPAAPAEATDGAAAPPPATGSNPWDYLGGGGDASTGSGAGAAPQGTVAEGEDPWAYLSGGGDDSDGDAGEIDLAALGLGGGGVDLPTYPELRLYGFVDTSLIYPLTDKDNAWSFWKADTPTFQVGSLNLYVDSRMSPILRSLVEVRFTYLPNGKDRTGLVTPDSNGAFQNAERLDTSVLDYADGERAFRYGSIEVERAWMEYAAFPWLRIMLGQWLTPYGLWNVDHGSPTTIGTLRPYIIGEGLFPERQTGLQFRGDFSSGWMRYGYHLGFSNGRGPMDTFLDLDDNKAVTGRAFAEMRDTFGLVSFGVTGYTGRFTDIRNRVLFGKEGLYNDPLLNFQFDEVVMGVDVKLEWGSFVLVYELISHQRRYTEQGRFNVNSLAPVADTTVGSLQTLLHPFAPGRFYATPDIHRRGMYLVTGYRFDWLGLMPFVEFQAFYLNERTMPETVMGGFGINARPHESVTVKLEFARGDFLGSDPAGPGRDPIRQSELQCAWAF